MRLGAGAYVARGFEYAGRPRPEDQAEAERLFHKALRIDPDLAPAHAGLARVSVYLYNLGLDESEGRLRTALDEARRAVALAPDDPRAAATLALALATADRLTPALEEARRAVSLGPESAEAHLAMGIVLRLRKDLEDSLAACRRAAEIAPDDPRILTALGDALREAGSHSQAMEMFGQATDLDHEAIAPQLGAAGALLKAGNLPLARRFYDLLLKDFDYGEGRIRLGAAALLVYMQEFEAAFEMYGTVSLPDGTALPALLALYGKGYSLTRLGRDAEAEYFFSSLIDRVKNDYDGPARGREILFDAYDDLIAYFQKRGRDRKVMALLRSACERPLVPTRLARALAERLEAGKEGGEAAPVLEKAILGSDPLEDSLELAESALKMVRMRTAGGARRLPDGSPAVRALDAVLERLRPGEPGAVHYRLARALALAQRSEESLASLERARVSGYLPADQMAGEPDFDRLRQTAAFQAFLDRRP
ncbi:MAG: tetratricopeptide repeat protein [Acidobacteria bacterium]|nr:tetratricopeptide repeat protein [Acidobacteriota bacterium]